MCCAEIDLTQDLGRRTGLAYCPDEDLVSSTNTHHAGRRTCSIAFLRCGIGSPRLDALLLDMLFYLCPRLVQTRARLLPFGVIGLHAGREDHDETPADRGPAADGAASPGNASRLPAGRRHRGG